jgi:hypothetical protein
MERERCGKWKGLPEFRLDQTDKIGPCQRLSYGFSHESGECLKRPFYPPRRSLERGEGPIKRNSKGLNGAVTVGKIPFTDLDLIYYKRAERLAEGIDQVILQPSITRCYNIYKRRVEWPCATYSQRVSTKPA